jgi:formate dehydrogenase iron-sulfur subunit
VNYAVLVDLTKCVGCRACVNGCKKWNNLPLARMDHFIAEGDRVDAYSPATEQRHRPNLNSKSYCIVEDHKVNEGTPDEEWMTVKRQCMHCLKPACNAACPVGALHQTEEGPVIYDSNKCIGCRYCMMACPFAVPTYDWDKAVPYVRKCTFCYDRIGAGAKIEHGQDEPACVAACPTRTLIFGDRDEMIAEAKRRQIRWPRLYQKQIFGETDAGGTRWLYLSPVPFAELGFPENLGNRAYPDYTKVALDAVPVWITGGGLAMASLFWLWKRKLELAGVDVEEVEDES